MEKKRHARLLLDWYDVHRRHFPWRAAPGEQADPYHVWLSEIMLQQTVVKTVIPYFADFLRTWPHLADLAHAQRDDILAKWAGLGYYARARNLHRCALEVVQNNGGRFPREAEQLIKLPGIGPYTATAIAAIAFDRPAVVVDGNVERVVARLFGVRTPLPAAKKELRLLAGQLTPLKRPGDYAQAMMDLGAAICTPNSPNCPNCPLAGHCTGYEEAIAAQLPRRARRVKKPLRRGIACFVTNCEGAILLRRRRETGLLAGMMEIPSSGWDGRGKEGQCSAQVQLFDAPVKTDWQRLSGVVRHVFTHFHLELTVYRTVAPLAARTAIPADCRWVAREDIETQALPSVMRKVIAHAHKAAAVEGG